MLRRDNDVPGYYEDQYSKVADAYSAQLMQSELAARALKNARLRQTSCRLIRTSTTRTFVLKLKGNEQRLDHKGKSLSFDVQIKQIQRPTFQLMSSCVRSMHYQKQSD